MATKKLCSVLFKYSNSRSRYWPIPLKIKNGKKIIFNDAYQQNIHCTNAVSGVVEKCTVLHRLYNLGFCSFLCWVMNPEKYFLFESIKYLTNKLKATLLVLNVTVYFRVHKVSIICIELVRSTVEKFVLLSSIDVLQTVYYLRNRTRV